MTAGREADRIAEPELRELYLYWAGKRGLRDYPAGSDIATEEIEALLPYVMLVDVLDDGRHFRFNMVGSDVAVGVNPVGKLQHEELPDGIYRDHITALFRRGAAGPGALYSRSSYAYTRDQGPRSISRLFLPLAGAAAGIDAMMIGQKSERPDSLGPSTWQANPPSITEELAVRLP